MQTYAQIEELYRLEKVTFYSIRLENEEYLETEKFILKFQKSEEYQEDCQDLIAWIKQMGKVEGALPDLFRPEADAQALPPGFRAMKKRGMLKTLGYNLRLYCVRISNEIVILLNGGIKESQKVQGSPDLITKFRMANNISKAVTQKIINRELWEDGRELKGDLELYI